ncbi:CaiB/BaiF CoA transferase family protein [Tenacibaculum agarivorans]|uniref:CaiB/BaiF CoA transferase family protein n=1 Tax=Tenacibaculum agarivorans TaxID=1908389 RepID=UPI00094B9119|nr:CoA transferase [Tenacibaculum agarivorans]
MISKPLHGVVVLDFSQFLSGPSASLKLADLGARVIKIEQPETGDICRSLYNSNIVFDESSTIFHAINRNKQSYQIDLKDESQRYKIEALLKKADVVIHNFRPGVAKRLGIDYESVKSLHPTIVYGEISGYGKEGPWKNKPGQDLLLQSLSGLTTLSGNDGDGPIPMGLPVVDLISGVHLAQGILACLFRKAKHNIGGIVEVSMLESILEFQFESITTYFHDGGAPTQRTKSNNAHPYLGAPYGVYQTKDGHMALAMGQIPVLGNLLECPSLLMYETFESWYDQRDEIKAILATHLQTKNTSEWLSVLEPADIWCADVLNWSRLFDTEAFQILNMIQEIELSEGNTLKTTRCPIQINDQILTSTLKTPKLGEHNAEVEEELKVKV